MLRAIRLRLIMAVHMVAPLSFVRWHTHRLDYETVASLIRNWG